MFRTMLSHFMFPLFLLFSISSGNSQFPTRSQEGQTGSLEKMMVASGRVAMDLDLNRLRGIGLATKESKLETLRFEVGPNSFFTILVFNNVLRGPEPGSMGLIRRNSAILPEPLNASSNQLVIEKLDSSERDIVVRDGKTGFVFFNIEGNLYEYDAAAHLLRINGARLLISDEFADKLGRPAEAGLSVGRISIATTMSPIETSTVVNGTTQSSILPPLGKEAQSALGGFMPVPGPDVIVGDLFSLQQFGSNGTQVGLAVGTTSCNAGDQELNWFALPLTDHPVIPQNLYRMSGGASNDERFEQIGQSWLKHAFIALQQNACGFGCNPAATGTHLGVGCSDPYDASLNASQDGLGSRAWVNPFTGAFLSIAAEHTGHSHSGVAHRILVEGADLNTTTNTGAKYFAEAQYVTPHEYTWCQDHPGQCNMYNNASYRRFNVTGTTSFAFTPVGSTVRTSPAINAWTGATINQVEPAPGVDGQAFIGYKVTNPTAGVWHYEYAINNQNLDRGIQSFSVPLGCGITVSNVGFHAPLNHPGFALDGTQGDAGYSNAPWTSNQTASALSWSSETFVQNQNANALRWGTLYNFRFDSNRPPRAVNATIGFFKTGTPITVGIQGPSPCNPLELTAAVSRQTHGSAGDFDIDLPRAGNPGIECRGGGATNDYTMVVSFAGNVSVTGSPQAQVTSGTGTIGSGGVSNGGMVSVSGNIVTIPLTNVADQQTINVTLNGVNSALIDQPAVNLVIPMSRLLGDTNGNRAVNASDVSQTKGRIGQTVSAANFRSDVNANGGINAGDVSLVKANSGHGVP